MRRDAVMMPISYDASEDEVSYRVRDAACVALVSLVEKRGSLQRRGANAPEVITAFFDEPSGS